jgi:hypothetical protein
MRQTMRQTIALFAAFTIGAMSTAVVYERKLGDLRVGIERYGYANTMPAERIEEDDPRWDCTTMGNRICGPSR